MIELPVTLSFETAVELLNRAVAEKGEDYVYPYADPDLDSNVGCRYFEDGEPSCIIGHVLFYLGVSAEQVSYCNTSSVYALREGNRYLVVDEKTYVLLSEAQAKQDSGFQWGVAVASALHEVQVAYA